MPALPRVEQLNRARRTLARDLDTRHLVAQFERHVERERATVGAGRQRELRFPEPLALGRQRIRDAGPCRAALGAHHDRVEAPLIGELRPEPERFATRRRHHHREPTATGHRHQPLGERAGRAIMIDAIGEPDDRARRGTAG